jgi:hypothetical protein
VFECGFTSFLGQNRTQFSISFFIFGLLFLLFDLEILLVYPYLVSSYINEGYGLTILLLFLLALTLGFAFELGKKALSIESRQIIARKFNDFYNDALNTIKILNRISSGNIIPNGYILSSGIGCRSFSTSTKMSMPNNPDDLPDDLSEDKVLTEQLDNQKEELNNTPAVPEEEKDLYDYSDEELNNTEEEIKADNNSSEEQDPDPIASARHMIALLRGAQEEDNGGPRPFQRDFGLTHEERQSSIDKVNSSQNMEGLRAELVEIQAHMDEVRAELMFTGYVNPTLDRSTFEDVISYKDKVEERLVVLQKEWDDIYDEDCGPSSNPTTNKGSGGNDISGNNESINENQADDNTINTNNTDSNSNTHTTPNPDPNPNPNPSGQTPTEYVQELEESSPMDFFGGDDG